MYRKIVAFALIGAVLFGSTGVISASSSDSNNVESQINKIYQERAALLVEKKDGYEKNYDKLGEKLESLGVDFLTPEEAQVEISQKQKQKLSLEGGDIQPLVQLPTSTNIKWSSYRANWVKNGVTYEVQHLTAESNAQNSQLKQSGVTAVQNSNSMQAGTANFMISAAKTTIGLSSNYVTLGIFVYDAIKNFISDSNFTKTTTIQNIFAAYTWSWIESVDFMFIKKASDSDSFQNLALVTSTVSGSVAASIPEFTYSANGATKSTTINQGTPKNFSYTAMYHRDASTALNYYLSGPTRYSFITEITLKGFENKTIQTIIPAQPIGIGSLY